MAPAQVNQKEWKHRAGILLYPCNTLLQNLRGLGSCVVRGLYWTYERGEAEKGWLTWNFEGVSAESLSYR